MVQGDGKCCAWYTDLAPKIEALCITRGAVIKRTRLPQYPRLLNDSAPAFVIQRVSDKMQAPKLLPSISRRALAFRRERVTRV